MTNNMRPLALEEAIRLALQHNLDVQIQQLVPDIARFNLSGAYAPYDPSFRASVLKSYRSSPGGFDPVTGLPNRPNDTDSERYNAGLSGELPTGLTYDLGGDMLRNYGNTIQGFQYQPGVAIDLTQPLLKNFWIDSTRQQISVDKKTLKYSELGLRQKIMDVVTQVEAAYYDFIFAIENVRVQEKALELAERLLAENKRRVEVGTMAPLDENQAESQTAGSRADLLSARNDLNAQQNLLKKLITDDYKVWHDVDIQPSEKLIAIPEKFNLLESWQRGMTLRPDLLQSRVEVERRDIILKYDKNQLFPQLDLIGSYGRNGLERHFNDSLNDISNDSNPAYSYGVRFSIPLSNRGPRNAYKAAKAQKEQALLQLKQLEETILVQIDDAVKRAQFSCQRVDATKQARLYAGAALEAEQKKLENGKSTSFIVLQLQKDLTSARAQEIRALADYNKALAQLAFDEGTVFERNHLTVDLK